MYEKIHMAKLTLLTLIFLLITIIFPIVKSQEQVTWAKRVDAQNQVVTTLQFYFHTGPEANSKVVGRARGMYGSAAQTDLGLIMAMSYYFTDGIYNGSSFSLLSINQALNPVREMAIVGGTGLFRMARGYAMAQTYRFDPTTGDAIVGYNVTLATNI